MDIARSDPDINTLHWSPQFGSDPGRGSRSDNGRGLRDPDRIFNRISHGVARSVPICAPETTDAESAVSFFPRSPLDLKRSFNQTDTSPKSRPQIKSPYALRLRPREGDSIVYDTDGQSDNRQARIRTSCTGMSIAMRLGDKDRGLSGRLRLVYFRARGRHR
jgi:hypothetical protein